MNRTTLSRALRPAAVVLCIAVFLAAFFTMRNAQPGTNPFFKSAWSLFPPAVSYTHLSVLISSPEEATVMGSKSPPATRSAPSVSRSMGFVMVRASKKDSKMAITMVTNMVSMMSSTISQVKSRTSSLLSLM